MDVARPYSAIVPSIDGDVLVVLAGTTRPLTGRQVAQLAQRGSQKAVSAVLDRLVEHGLVHRQQAGRAHLHTLNRDHVAAPAVEALARLRSELFERIGRSVTGWVTPAVNVSMFGSAARGDGDVESDIDLFIVRPEKFNMRWDRQLHALSDDILRWTGNHAAIVEFALEDLPQLVRSSPPVLDSLRADAVDLAGTSLRALLRDAEGRV